MGQVSFRRRFALARQVGFASIREIRVKTPRLCGSKSVFIGVHPRLESCHHEAPHRTSLVRDAASAVTSFRELIAKQICRCLLAGCSLSFFAI